MDQGCEVSRRGCLPPFSGSLALEAAEDGDSPYGGERQDCSPEPPNGCTVQLPPAASKAAGFGQDPSSCYIPLRRLQDLASMISSEYLNGSKDGSECLQELERSDSSPESPELCRGSPGLGDPENFDTQQDSARLLDFDSLRSCLEEDKEVDSEASFLTAEENPEEEIKFVMKNNTVAAPCSEEAESESEPELIQGNQPGGSIEIRHNETFSAFLSAPLPPQQIQSNSCRESGVGSRTEKTDLHSVSCLPGDTARKIEKQFGISKGRTKKKPIPIKYEAGDLVWAKFNRRPWWPCKICHDPVLDTHSKMKVSNRRPYREYYVEALGEPSERAWVVGKAIVVFEGRHQFEELPVLRRRGKQKEKGYRHKVPKRFMAKWEISIGLTNEYHKQNGTKKCTPSSSKSDCEKDMDLMGSCMKNEPKRQINGCLKSLATDSKNMTNEKGKTFTKSRIKKSSDSRRRNRVRKSSTKLEISKREGKGPVSKVKNMIAEDLPDKQASHELCRIAKSLMGSKGTVENYLLSSFGERQFEKKPMKAECELSDGGSEEGMLQVDLKKKKNPAGFICSSKLQRQYSVAGAETKRKHMDSDSPVSGTSDLDPLDQSIVSATYGVLKNGDSVNKRRKELSSGQRHIKHSACVSKSSNRSHKSLEATLGRNSKVEAGGDGFHEPSIAAEVASVYRNNLILVDKHTALQRKGFTSQLDAKEPQFRSIKCKHKGTAAGTESSLKEDECSPNCCFSATKGSSGSRLDTPAKSGLVDDPTLPNSTKEKSHDSAEIETAVVKHVLSELKELSYRSRNDEVKDSGPPKTTMPLLFSSVSGQNHLPIEPDYKFSTLLMLLKDMHDSKTKEKQIMTTQNIFPYRSSNSSSSSGTNTLSDLTSLSTVGAAHKLEKIRDSIQEPECQKPKEGQSFFPRGIATNMTHPGANKREFKKSTVSGTNCTARRSYLKSKQLSRLVANATSKSKSLNRLSSAAESVPFQHRTTQGSVDSPLDNGKEDIARKVSRELMGHFLDEDSASSTDDSLVRVRMKSESDKKRESYSPFENGEILELDSGLTREGSLGDEPKDVSHVAPKKRWQRFNQSSAKAGKQISRSRKVSLLVFAK